MASESQREERRERERDRREGERESVTGEGERGGGWSKIESCPSKHKSGSSEKKETEGQG